MTKEKQNYAWRDEAPPHQFMANPLFDRWDLDEAKRVAEVKEMLREMVL
jgi:hypothetical protein